MSFASHRMHLAFGTQTEQGFNWYAYSTHDPLEEVLAPGYFDAARRAVRPGDLVLVGTETKVAQPWDTRRYETRRALVMIAQAPAQGPVTTRLVADFGTPEDPSAPLLGQTASGEKAAAVVPIGNAARGPKG